MIDLEKMVEFYIFIDLMYYLKRNSNYLSSFFSCCLKILVCWLNLNIVLKYNGKKHLTDFRKSGNVSFYDPIHNGCVRRRTKAWNG